MAIPNADNTGYDSGSPADQETRARRNERIRLVAERDRLWRDLQKLRGVAALELRGMQTLNRTDAAGTFAKNQAEVITLERRLQQLEQTIADFDSQSEQRVQQNREEGVVAGTTTPEKSTSDILSARRGGTVRQIAGQASF